MTQSATGSPVPDVSAIPLPPQRLRFMNEDDERLVPVGVQHADVLRRHGMSEHATLLDVGCGYGRLPIGLLASGFQGHYLGFEILKKQVTWCRNTLTPFSDGQLQFVHLDIRNSRYNPEGTISSHEARFPARRATHDFVSVLSVFTHMYEADIRRYLSEVRRVLTPGGRAVTTWFLLDEQRLAAATDPARTRFPMVNLISDDVRYTEPTDPLRAIAYDQAFARRMIAESGLRVESITRGSWCGDPSSDFQDVVVLTHAPDPRWKQAVRRSPARGVARRAQRLLRR